jgi:hypothetical protein
MPWRCCTGSGIPGSLLTCRRPLSPLTPGSPAAAHARYFTTGYRFHRLREPDHYRMFHEAETGSLALRLTSSPSRASTTRLPPSPPSRFHGERAIAMVSSFQLIRSTKLTRRTEVNEDGEPSLKRRPRRPRKRTMGSTANRAQCFRRQLVDNGRGVRSIARFTMFVSLREPNSRPGASGTKEVRSRRQLKCVISAVFGGRKNAKNEEAGKPGIAQVTVILPSCFPHMIPSAFS